MNQLETKFAELVPHLLGEIVKQLKIMNRLKALELKGRLDLSNVSASMVDDIVEN